MRGNGKGAFQYFSKIEFFFIEYHSLSVDPWTCMETVHIPFISSLLEFITALQIVWKGHMSLVCTVFINTAVFWWWSLELLMSTENRKIYRFHTFLCNIYIYIFFFYFHEPCVYMFGTNNLKIMLHFMKGNLREDSKKYVPYYWITSLIITYPKLSRKYIVVSWPNQKPYCCQISCNVSC
jgi:hypothetical protein